MIETLVHWDMMLFKWVHCTLANDAFDWLMPILREAKNWIPLYLLFVFLAIKNYKTKGLYIVLATALVVVLCDRFSAGFMKPFFERLRPCHEPSLAAHIRHLIDCGGQYGFISSHATNHFGLAVMFTWFFKKIATKNIAKAVKPNNAIPVRPKNTSKIAMSAKFTQARMMAFMTTPKYNALNFFNHKACTPSYLSVINSASVTTLLLLHN